MSERALTVAPSGIPSIDYAIGLGGVPRGGIIEVFGPSASGKSFTALAFSAYAQSQGERAGYMNAERAPMQTFLPLVPGLNIDALEYGEPPVAPEDASRAQKELWDGSGEATLETSRRFINSGEFGIWTIDSVHALVSRTALGAPIGSKQASAALARLMSEAIPVMEHEIHGTNTACIFVNHVKAVPNARRFEKKWSKPGGSALDYYAAIALQVTRGQSYIRREDDRQIGHKVRVKVMKSKIALPFQVGEYDLFYGTGTLRDDGRFVEPGIDTASSWMSVLKESGTIRWVGSAYWGGITGEKIGSEAEVREMMQDSRSDLFQAARELVYPDRFANARVAA